MLKKCRCDISEEIEIYGRPMHMAEKPKRPIKAQTGAKLQCKNWDSEAALRMFRNNLHPQAAVDAGVIAEEVRKRLC